MASGREAGARRPERCRAMAQKVANGARPRPCAFLAGRGRRRRRLRLRQPNGTSYVATASVTSIPPDRLHWRQSNGKAGPCNVCMDDYGHRARAAGDRRGPFRCHDHATRHDRQRRSSASSGQVPALQAPTKGRLPLVAAVGASQATDRSASVEVTILHSLDEYLPLRNGEQQHRAARVGAVTQGVPPVHNPCSLNAVAVRPAAGALAPRHVPQVRCVHLHTSLHFSSAASSSRESAAFRAVARSWSNISAYRRTSGSFSRYRAPAMFST